MPPSALPSPTQSGAITRPLHSMKPSDSTTKSYCYDIALRSPVSSLGDHMAEPDGAEAEQQRQADIGGGGQRPAALQQGERLQAEGGEGGIAAAQPDHDELPAERAHIDAAVGAGEGGEAADDEGADEVDDDGAPGEKRPPQRHRQQAAAVAGETAQGAADADDEIGDEGVHGGP